MNTFQERVVKEKEELDDKINKLTAFFTTNIYQDLDPHSKNLLSLQKNAMTLYSTILSMRIEIF